MLNGVDSPVDDFDDLVKDDECRLQAGELDKGLNCSHIRLSRPVYLLPALPETSEAEVVDLFFLVTLELGKEDARYVLLLRPNSELGLLDRLLHLESNVASDSIGNFCQ